MSISIAENRTSFLVDYQFLFYFPFFIVDLNCTLVSKVGRMDRKDVYTFGYLSG